MIFYASVKTHINISSVLCLNLHPSTWYTCFMRLALPSTDYKDSYLKALEESKNETSTTVLRRPAEGETFAAFVSRVLGEASGLRLPEGWVPATEFWLIDKDEFIGHVNIRHTLTEHLLHIGGHIGYYIRPSKRKMGYGNMILKLALPEAKKLR